MHSFAMRRFQDFVPVGAMLPRTCDLMAFGGSLLGPR